MMKLVVFSCLVAAVYGGALIAPLAYTAPLAYSAPLGIAPLAYSAWDGNYRGPLSLAPGQPANILGSDGRPLDTLEVNLDRSAHITAKALEGSGIHLLKKRSVVAPIAPISYTAPITYSAPISYSAPIAYSSPYITPGLGLSYSPYAYTTFLKKK